MTSLVDIGSPTTESDAVSEPAAVSEPTAVSELTATAGWVTVSTPRGPFTAVADADGRVLASGWTDDPHYLVALIHSTIRPESIAPSVHLTDIADAIEAYHDGDLTAPDAIPVLSKSGPFIEKAWAALRSVPAGQTVSYQRFAELSGEPLAIRAAASACARNPAALFVPCHRVLRSNGKLGGFRYGLEIKEWLLTHEQPAHEQPEQEENSTNPGSSSASSS